MPRPPSLSKFSTAQLENIIAGRRTEVGRLERQRAKIARKLNQIDARIAQLGGSIGARMRNGTGRVKNAKSLNEMLMMVLGRSSKPMKVGDIADAVRSGGYRT